VQLAHTNIAGQAPSQYAVLFLHGILGRGTNWRMIAKTLVERRPELLAVLVDLRMHGESQAFAPPHTVSSAAHDVERLAETLAVPVRGIVGHSFGGKVALAVDIPTLERRWIIDSLPGARPQSQQPRPRQPRRHREGSETTIAILAMLRRFPSTFPTRAAFVERVVAEGHPEPLGRWLAMNLVRHDVPGEPDEYRWPLDLDAIDALLEDYFAVDLWSRVEDSPENIRVDLVLGGASPVFDEADRRRAAAAARRPGVHLHVVEGAGHWVHVDAPDEVIAVLSDLSAPSP
jgi:pimeloyl-ACP methyl ester carboxylesterase